MAPMSARDFVALIHLAGFITGIALYGMLAAMAWRTSRSEGVSGTGRIPVLAALLGLIWNASALLMFAWEDFGLGELSPWLATISYAALGFLPAVVVDSATRPPGAKARPTPLALAAYVLSGAGALMQAGATANRGGISSTGLVTLTLGYIAIVVALAVTSNRRAGSSSAVTAVALAAFAVSAFHLSRHSAAGDSWMVELIGHHASLPLVLVILYQDYRFALADLFLKRAIAILALVALVVASYALLTPLGSGSPVVLLACWVGTALLFPTLRNSVDNLVDRVILRRADYRLLRSRVVAALARAESPTRALDLACKELGEAFTAARVSWTEDQSSEANPEEAGDLVSLDGWAEAHVRVRPSDAPCFTISLGGLAKGRRLLSDDVALLDSVALLIARRIDEIRVADERLERDVRESEMQRLATEAELRALRAQLNPHFLFNALTTIGYLIRSSPPLALDALYQLTTLLRAVLRGVSGDFVRLADELHIVESYLAIEQARFEDRLKVEHDIPSALDDLLIPPLILQPIVENAIKHGIAPLRAGGLVRLEATLDSAGDGPARLSLRVIDTGGGVNSAELVRRRALGVGLSNLERRLHQYFGPAGRLSIVSTPGLGTTVEITLPVARRAARPLLIGGSLGPPTREEDVAELTTGRS